MEYYFILRYRKYLDKFLINSLFFVSERNSNTNSIIILNK